MSRRRRMCRVNSGSVMKVERFEYLVSTKMEGGSEGQVGQEKGQFVILVTNQLWLVWGRGRGG